MLEPKQSNMLYVPLYNVKWDRLYIYWNLILEPDLYHNQHEGPGVQDLNGTQIGKDFQVLHKLLTLYNFTNYKFVGPDIAGASKRGATMFKE